MSEVVRLEPCPACGHGLEAGAAFCPGCGKRAKREDAPTDLRSAAADFASGTLQEVRTLSIEALRSDTGKKIAGGAALGAVVGSVVPLVGPMIGATLGAGYVAFKRLTK